MLSLNFKESLEQEIRLPNKRLEDILELLKYIYPNFGKEFDGKFQYSNIQVILISQIMSI